MRKIISKHEEERKRKRNILILGIILIFVMFASVFGIIVNSFGNNNNNGSKIEYNGYEFENQNGLWFTSKDNLEFVFKNFPNESINATPKINPLYNYRNKPLYVYSEDSDSEIEIYRNFAQIAERIQQACLNAENCTGNFPIKTCSDNFIIIQENEIQEIKQEKNCVYIKGKKEELLKLTDEFLFNAIGIK